MTSLEALKELSMWATNGYTACDEEKAKELCSIIERDLKAFKVINEYAGILELYHDLCCIVADDDDLEACKEALDYVNKRRL